MYIYNILISIGLEGGEKKKKDWQIAKKGLEHITFGTSGTF